MKKALLAIAMLVVFGTTAMAQNALGLRAGAGSGTNCELSYQMGLGSNRLELDLGWWGNDNWAHYNLTGVYQWTGDITGPLGWYLGVGAQLGWGIDKFNNSSLGLAIGGQAGLELNFDFPIQLTLDTRPMWNFIGDDNRFDLGLALGIRYKF